MLKKIISILVFSSIFFLFPLVGKSAGPGMGGAPCWPPPCTIPLDGGISLLIVAGAALAGKKLLNLRKGNSNQ